MEGICILLSPNEGGGISTVIQSSRNCGLRLVGRRLLEGPPIRQGSWRDGLMQLSTPMVPGG